MPEIEQMRLAHFITIGSECSASLAADYRKAYDTELRPLRRIEFAFCSLFSGFLFGQDNSFVVPLLFHFI